MARKGINLIGLRVGELVVEAPAGRDEKEKSRLWFCRADCGGSALRTARWLLRAKRHGYHSLCADCRRRAKGQHKGVKGFKLRRLWDYTGQLWSNEMIDVLTRRIREDVIDELGPWRDPERLILHETFDASPYTDTKIGNDATMTLDEVGAELGISRERVRQIEAVALGKLRHMSWFCTAARGDLMGELAVASADLDYCEAMRERVGGVSHIVSEAAVQKARVEASIEASKHQPIKRKLTVAEIDAAIQRAYAFKEQQK